MELGGLAMKMRGQEIKPRGPPMKLGGPAMKPGGQTKKLRGLAMKLGGPAVKLASVLHILRWLYNTVWAHTLGGWEGVMEDAQPCSRGTCALT